MINDKDDLAARLDALDNTFHYRDPLYTHVAVKYDMRCILHGYIPTREQREKDIQSLYYRHKRLALFQVNYN